MIEQSTHPYLVLGFLKRRYGTDLVFQFSRYVYEPQQLLDNRTTFEIPARDCSIAQINELISSLNSNEELALHSKLKRKGRNYHIPMIDFSVGQWSKLLESELRKYLPKKVEKELLVFKSGRSFHGYSVAMLEPGEWRSFMGRLLLVNPPSGSQWIDARWVGHRLIGGFSSLRWSCNTPHYKDLPKLLDSAERFRYSDDSEM